MKKNIALAIIPLLATACMTMPPPPPATLSYAGRECDSTPNLGRAVSLVPERRRAHHMVRLPVDDVTPCLRNGGAATPYILYAIPSTGVHIIEVGSRLEQARIFSPEIALLDQDGDRVRTFAPDQYLYRGGFFSVQFVPQSNERYILITAEPSRVGQSYDAVAISTSTTYVYTGFGMASWTSGHDQNVSRIFSYEGSVAAVVHSVEPERRPAR